MRAWWMALAMGVVACGGSVDETSSVNGQGGSAGQGGSGSGGSGTGGSGGSGTGGSGLGSGSGGSGAGTGGSAGGMADVCLREPQRCCDTICASVRSACNVTTTQCECDGSPPGPEPCASSYAAALGCVADQGEAAFGCDASGSGVLLCGPCDDALAAVARDCGQEIQCTFR